MAQIRGLRWEIFNLMAQNVCRECITFERITVLLYVGGKMAVKVGPELVPLVLVHVRIVR